jgi:hypothetical protein
MSTQKFFQEFGKTRLITAQESLHKLNDIVLQMSTQKFFQEFGKTRLITAQESLHKLNDVANVKKEFFS